MTEQTTVKNSQGGKAGSPLVPIAEELLEGLMVTLDIRLGTATMPAGDVMKLKSGSLVTLEESLADHVDLYLNGAVVARGEIVAIGDKYGVRITEVASDK